MAPIPPPEASPSVLDHVPVSIFTVPMGLLGFALALRAASLGMISAGVGIIGALVLAACFITFAAKLIRQPAACAAEWSHPVKLAFFPAASIALLLVASLLLDLAPGSARVIWVIGATAQGLLTLVILSSWIGHRAFGPQHLSPAWFLPAVGNVAAPLGGVPLGFVETSWYFFSVGVLFWLVLLTLIFNRLIFHDPLPSRLRPTIVILVAPPALACSAWILLQGGEVDELTRIFLNLGYLFAALVAVQLPRLLRLPFALSFWALSFPTAAITVASFRFADATGSDTHIAFGWGLLAVLATAIAVLTLRTLIDLRRGTLFPPE